MFNDTHYRKEVEEAKIKKCQCDKNLINCECKKKDEDFFKAWTDSLEKMEQPKACEINNPDCDNCGS